MSRQLTEDEVKALFIRKVWAIVDYWQTLPNPSCPPAEGVAFNILSTIDGSACDLPGFHLIPFVSAEDRDYFIRQDENYFPVTPQGVSDGVDIAGSLHDAFSQYKRNQSKGEQ